jgi:GMP synthase (glutamine-hydrolysing)
MDAEPRLGIAVLNGYPRKSRQNFDRTGVGHPHDFFRDFLKRHLPSAAVETWFVADPDQDLPEGAALADYAGFIWTGSDLTIYHDEDSRVTRQIALARDIFEAGVPSCGSCWGIQMAAVAAGGTVAKNPKGREWCIARDIRLTPEGRRSPLMAGKPECFDGFIMHLDEVTRLPPGATLLATGDHTRVQALEVNHGKGTFWATQYHPEFNLKEMARLIAARATPLTQEGFFAREEEVAAFAARLEALHADSRSAVLREELQIGDDILDPAIREQELRNWIDRLVLPAFGKR